MNTVFTVLGCLAPPIANYRPALAALAIAFEFPLPCTFQSRTNKKTRGMRPVSVSTLVGQYFADVPMSLDSPEKTGTRFLTLAWQVCRKLLPLTILQSCETVVGIYSIF